MTTKLILINTDTHVVVPRYLTKLMDDVLYDGRDTNLSSDELYAALVAAAPPLTTPPVLRWEGDDLLLGTAAVASVHEAASGAIWAVLEFKRKCIPVDNFEQARRAAEKALGLPEIEEEV